MGAFNYSFCNKEKSELWGERKDVFSEWKSLSCRHSLAEKMRYPVSFPDKDINYYLKMLKGEVEERHQLRPVLKSVPEKGPVILLRSGVFGSGDETYSRKLLNKFVFALTKVPMKPKMIIAINEGVLLMTEDSPVLDSLRILEKQGVQIYLSSNCSEFYKCTQDVKIGTPVDIYEISGYLLNSNGIISP